MRHIAVAALVALFIPAPAPAPASAVPDRVEAVREKLRQPGAGILVVAHRGCHNPAPGHGLPSAPENSFLALEHCLRIGADMMETDVRRTADGYLVIIHDDTVDRTTDGTGKVAELTLGQLRKLHLRENFGGPEARLTDQRILTLDELLAAARGRIMLNLDVKDSSFPETMAAVRRANALDGIVIKSEVGVGSAAMAATAPYEGAMYMPIIGNPGGSADLAAVATRQMEGADPVAFELPRMTLAQLPPIARFAREHGRRLLVNTIFSGFVTDAGGDVDALRDPEGVWGTLFRQGISIFQTDEPEALVRYRTAGALR